PFSELRRKFDSGSAHCLARRHRGELREPIEKLRLFLFEIAQRIVIRHLGGIGESQGSGRDQGQRPNGAVTCRETRPQIRKGVAESGNRTDAGDRDALRHFAVFAARSFSIPSTISRMVRMLRAASSGISRSNSPSSANRILIPSRESMFNSSKLLSMVTVSGGIFW